MFQGHEVTSSAWVIPRLAPRGGGAGALQLLPLVLGCREGGVMHGKDEAQVCLYTLSLSLSISVLRISSVG